VRIKELFFDEKVSCTSNIANPNPYQDQQKKEKCKTNFYNFI